MEITAAVMYVEFSKPAISTLLAFVASLTDYNHGSAGVLLS
jgi:hypothetical protein